MSGPLTIQERRRKAAELARRRAIVTAADEAFDASPGAPLTPEIAAVLRRILPPAPRDGEQAA
jgi:hypothetical protein